MVVHVYPCSFTWIILVQIHTGILTWNRTGIFLNVQVYSCSWNFRKAGLVCDFKSKSLLNFWCHKIKSVISQNSPESQFNFSLFNFVRDFTNSIFDIKKMTRKQICDTKKTHIKFVKFDSNLWYHKYIWILWHHKIKFFISYKIKFVWYHKIEFVLSQNRDSKLTIL